MKTRSASFVLQVLHFKSGTGVGLLCFAKKKFFFVSQEILWNSQFGNHCSKALWMDGSRISGVMCRSVRCLFDNCCVFSALSGQHRWSVPQGNCSWPLRCCSGPLCDRSKPCIINATIFTTPSAMTTTSNSDYVVHNIVIQPPVFFGMMVFLNTKIK